MTGVQTCALPIWRKNGLRADLAQTLADLHPRFVRFPRKVRRTVEAAVLGNLLNGQVTGQQQTLGLTQTVLQQILMRRTADVSLEAADKVGFADAAHLGKVVQRNVIGKMTVNIRQCRCKQLADDGGSHGLRCQTAQNAVDGNGNLVLVHGGKLRAHAVLRRVHNRAELVLERQHRLLFVHKAKALGQIFGVLLAACTVEVKPVEVNLVRTPGKVYLPPFIHVFSE